MGLKICRIWLRLKELFVGNDLPRESYSILYIHLRWLVSAETPSSGPVSRLFCLENGPRRTRRISLPRTGISLFFDRGFWTRKQKEILEDSQASSQNSINGFRLGQEHKIELEDTPVLSCLTQFDLIILLKLYLCPEWRRIEARPGLGIVSVSHFEHISRSVTFHFRPTITLFHAQAPPKSASPAEISSPHCPSPCSPPTFPRLPSSGL